MGKFYSHASSYFSPESNMRCVSCCKMACGTFNNPGSFIAFMANFHQMSSVLIPWCDYGLPLRVYRKAFLNCDRCSILIICYFYSIGVKSYVTHLPSHQNTYLCNKKRLFQAGSHDRTALTTPTHSGVGVKWRWKGLSSEYIIYSQAVISIGEITRWGQFPLMLVWTY